MEQIALKIDDGSLCRFIFDIVDNVNTLYIYTSKGVYKETKISKKYIKSKRSEFGSELDFGSPYIRDYEYISIGNISFKSHVDWLQPGYAAEADFWCMDNKQFITFHFYTFDGKNKLIEKIKNFLI